MDSTSQLVPLKLFGQTEPTVDAIFAPEPPPQPAAAETTSSDLPAARLTTLGCKVNQYETEFVRELLIANGYRDARGDEAAALAVVNTCTVTAESDRKSRQLIRQIARKDPGAKIIVMGCYATADPEAVRRLPGVAAVITDKRELATALEPFGVKKRVRTIRSFEGRHRAFVKVQDGCILNCTFCIIPKVRPGLLSRPVHDIVEEVGNLIQAGYREIVLTGIHLGHYGVDLSQGLQRNQWQRLSHLLERLCRLPGEFRIRLSSLEAAETTPDLFRVLADHRDRICPHLHLSMQSGSNDVLARMKRRYRIESFLRKCDTARELLDSPALTTDVIVGFPGETERDFQATIDAATEAGFAKMHIFPFSPRKGTEAAAFANQIAPEALRDRKERLAAVEHELAEAYLKTLVGRRLEMLIEGPDPDRPDFVRGTACRQAPLRLKTLGALAGRLVPVVAQRVCDRTVEVEPYFAAETTESAAVQA